LVPAGVAYRLGKGLCGMGASRMFLFLVIVIHFILFIRAIKVLEHQKRAVIDGLRSREVPAGEVRALLHIHSGNPAGGMLCNEL